VWEVSRSINDRDPTRLEVNLRKNPDKQTQDYYNDYRNLVEALDLSSNSIKQKGSRHGKEE
jgi:hypothetical protein